MMRENGGLAHTNADSIFHAARGSGLMRWHHQRRMVHSDRFLRSGLVSTISFSGVARMGDSLLGNNVFKVHSWPTFASPRLRLPHPSCFCDGRAPRAPLHPPPQFRY